MKLPWTKWRERALNAEKLLAENAVLLRQARNQPTVISVIEHGREVTFRFMRNSEIRDINMIRTLDLNVSEIRQWLLK